MVHTPFERFSVSTLFWNSQTAALAVSLTPMQLKRFDVPGSYPHISLAKPKHWYWEDLGEFVSPCRNESNWTVSADPNVLSAYKKPPQKNMFEHNALSKNCGTSSHHRITF